MTIICFSCLLQENDPAYKERIDSIKKQKVEMEVKLAELNRGLPSDMLILSVQVVRAGYQMARGFLVASESTKNCLFI